MERVFRRPFELSHFRTIALTGNTFGEGKYIAAAKGCDDIQLEMLSL